MPGYACAQDTVLSCTLRTVSPVPSIYLCRLAFLLQTHEGQLHNSGCISTRGVAIVMKCSK